MSSDIETLNSQFGIGDQIHFRNTGGGFIVAEIENDHCAASIALNGAHLLTWQPHDVEPVIWMSRDARFENGRSIRGGIPVCWPWFGSHSVEPSYPAHGFARTSLWQVAGSESLENGCSSITLRLDIPAGFRLWPFASSCEISFRIGRTLEIELTTHNHSSEPLIISQALHTYFRISDIEQVTVRGLDKRDYLDKPDNFARKHQLGDISFTGEVDRIYLDTTDDCLIIDPVLSRNIRIEKSGSHSTVVWNPWSERAAEMGDLGLNGWRTMLCVESSNAAQDIVSIAPGGSHTLGIRYLLE